MFLHSMLNQLWFILYIYSCAVMVFSLDFFASATAFLSFQLYILCRPHFNHHHCSLNFFFFFRSLYFIVQMYAWSGLLASDNPIATLFQAFQIKMSKFFGYFFVMQFKDEPWIQEAKHTAEWKKKYDLNNWEKQSNDEIIKILWNSHRMSSCCVGQRAWTSAYE